MTVGSICNREVIVALSDETVADAIRLMRQHHVGDLVIIRNRGKLAIPVGILTDRDILISVIGEGLEPADLLIKDIIMSDPVTVREDYELEDAVKLMRTRGVRILPVTGKEGELVGIVSLDDILDLLAEEVADLSALIHMEQRREIHRTARHDPSRQQRQ